MRKQVSNCLWMAPWGQKRGVIKGSPRGHQGVTEPRGTRRTWGNRCAHRLGHSDGFRCVCACVCQIHETAPLNVCIYSNKAIQMVIRYGIFQCYKTSVHIVMRLGKLGGQGVYLFPLQPLTSEPELSTWIVSMGSECAYAHRKHTSQAMHLHMHMSTQPAPHLSYNFCHLPRCPLGSGPTLQQTNPSPNPVEPHGATVTLQPGGGMRGHVVSH